MKSFSNYSEKTFYLYIIVCYSVFKEQIWEFNLSKLNKKLGINKRLLVLIILLRKEVIHPHVLVGMPCYDLTPIIGPTLDSSLLTVMSPASGITNSHGLTGGVYKPRERIHRGMLIRDY